jgi:hypothetical protein
MAKTAAQQPEVQSVALPRGEGDQHSGEPAIDLGHQRVFEARRVPGQRPYALEDLPATGRRAGGAGIGLGSGVEHEPGGPVLRARPAHEDAGGGDRGPR